MSKIVRTINLGLTKYSGITLPLFFGDYSSDMQKIDDAWGTLESRLTAIDDSITDHESRISTLETCCTDVNDTLTNYGQRIAVIEDVISTVSTQNINDIIARVDALEYKVETNSKQIHEINDNITSINTRLGNDETIIRNNTNKITAVEGRVSILEECCEEVRDILNAHTVRISKNESDISDIILRITRDESNIAGNANDIVILSEQVQTNAHNIDELTHALDDIDPSSTLELVRQVAENTDNITSLFSITSAQTDRIDGIITRLATDEVRITDLERRMTSAEDALEQVGQWQEQIDNLSANVEQLETDVTDLTTLVNGYESRISALESDDATFTSYMTSNNTRVGNIEGRVTALETADTVLDSRLDSIEEWKILVDADRTTYDAYIVSNDARVLAIETDIGSENISNYGATVKAAILESFSRIATLQSSVRNIIGWDSVNNTWKSLIGVSATDVIDAINESVGNIGDLTLLATNVKTDLVSAINEVFNKPNVPTGIINPYGGSVAPNGWLICDGSAVSRDTYSELFAVIGTAYGTGDGSTTFNLPDLRNKTTFGVGNGTGGIANVGDATVGSLPKITGNCIAGRITVRTYNMPETNGALKIYANDGGQTGLAVGNGNTDWATAGWFDFDSSRVSSIYKTTSQVVPASVGVNYIIKI